MLISKNGNSVTANVVVVIQKDNGITTYKIVTVYPDYCNEMKGETFMKELDVVTLKSDFNGVSAGTQGTIVLEYDGTAFEVEFFDKEGRTLDVLTSPAELIELA